MSGFLRRLARQAMGTGGSVRSAARLPYAPPPPLAEQAGEAARSSPPPLTRPAAPAQREPAGEPVPRPAAGAGEADAPAREAEELRPAPPQRQGPIRAPAPELAGEPGQGDDGDTPRPVEARRARRSRDIAITGVALEPAPQDAGNDRIDGPAPGDGQAFPVAGLHLADPLLPPQRARRPGSRGTGVPAPRAAIGSPRQASVEETTEVHVSIGRIEVTAVHEAPPAKPPPPRRAGPMTLAEYLARRQRGGA